MHSSAVAFACTGVVVQPRLSPACPAAAERLWERDLLSYQACTKTRGDLPRTIIKTNQDTRTAGCCTLRLSGPAAGLCNAVTPLDSAGTSPTLYTGIVMMFPRAWYPGHTNVCPLHHRHWHHYGQGFPTSPAAPAACTPTSVTAMWRSVTPLDLTLTPYFSREPMMYD